MTLADDFLALTTDLSEQFGSPVTLTVPGGVAGPSGTVVETPADYAVIATGPVDESRRWSSSGTDARVVATFYVPASGLAITPSTGHRITYQSRRFVVVASQPYTIQGVVISHRLDCGEIGNG